MSDASGEAVAPPAGRTIEGALVATDETDGTLTILPRNGTLYRVETDDATTFERNNEGDAALAEFLAGDLVKARIGNDGIAAAVEGTGSATA